MKDGATVIALVNNKGGVGKSTTAINLAAGLAERDRVLLVDLDSQGSASLGLGVARADLSPSVADVLFDGRQLPDVVRQTDVDRLDLVTGSVELANGDLALANMTGRERQLKKAVDLVRNRYDFIIIDCPPSLSLLPVNALVAADFFVVPVVPHYLALEGLVGLMTAVEQIKAGIGEVADFLGVLFTMVDNRPRAAAEIKDMIRSHYGAKVFKAEVPMTTKITEAPSFGVPVYRHAPTAKGSLAYWEAVDETRKKCRKALRMEGRKAGRES